MRIAYTRKGTLIRIVVLGVTIPRTLVTEHVQTLSL